MSSKKALRRRRGGDGDSEPAILNRLVQIDVANLANIELSKRDIEDLVQRLRKFLLATAGSAIEAESSTAQTGQRAAVASMAASGTFGGRDGGGGRGGGSSDNPIVPGCVLVDVVEAWRVVQGKGRWVRVELYSCPNGTTYERIV